MSGSHRLPGLFQGPRDPRNDLVTVLTDASVMVRDTGMPSTALRVTMAASSSCFRAATTDCQVANSPSQCRCGSCIFP